MNSWRVDSLHKGTVMGQVFLSHEDIRMNLCYYPDSKVHGASLGPIGGRQDPGGPHVCPLNLAICVCSLMMCANNGVHYGPIVIFIYFYITLPHDHHYADIWKYWTPKRLVRYILSSVCLRLSLYCNYLSCNIWGSVYSAYPFDDENTCTLSYYHHKNQKYEPFAIV